jgi:hypothetical protein
MLIDQEKDCEALQWPRRESQEIDVATKDRGSCCLSRERSFTHENALASRQLMSERMTKFEKTRTLVRHFISNMQKFKVKKAKGEI